MIPIISVEQTRKIESSADKNGLSYAELMDRAGNAAATLALRMMREITDPKITILVGSGNNGGDGLVTAYYLAEFLPDAQIRVYLSKLREDHLLEAVGSKGILIASMENDRDRRVLKNMVASSDLLIDALLGIGVKLPLREDISKLLRTVHESLHARENTYQNYQIVYPSLPQNEPRIAYPQILAIDCPSGLDCDTGETDRHILKANETITFIAPKPGLFLSPGLASVGELTIAPLGIPQPLWDEVPTEKYLIDGNSVHEALPERHTDSHKGSYGKSLIVAGSVNYTGAPRLAGEGAYRMGAGLVTIATPRSVVAMTASALAEVTWITLPDDSGVISHNAVSVLLNNIQEYNSMLIGPGLGTEGTTQKFLSALLEQNQTGSKQRSKRSIGFTVKESENSSEGEMTAPIPPLIIDADGLNLLSKFNEWWKMIPSGTIITPHPREMARLCKMDTKEIQESRWDIASRKAQEWGVIVLLKGAHTVIASPEGKIAILPFKVDALATAGTGDILAGLITGLVAQGVAPFEAAYCGGYIHGLAGVLATQKYNNSRSVIAGDVLKTIPEAIQIIEMI